MSDEYVAIVFGKNMENTIRAALDSLLRQTLRPQKILVVDDGSTDGTRGILTSYLERNSDIIQVIRFPESPYDLRRIPFLWNSALEVIERMKPCPSYLLIGADDDLYAPCYAEYLISQMKSDSMIVIGSGTLRDTVSLRSKNPAPEGGGRMISLAFLEKIGGRFPTFYGYESWILYKALQLGYEIRKFPDLVLRHARPLGKVHGFREWGAAMACADFHPLYVILLAINNLLFNWKLLPRRAVIRMTVDYFRAFRKDTKADFALRKWKEVDPGLVEWLRGRQIARLEAVLTKPVRSLIGSFK